MKSYKIASGKLVVMILFSHGVFEIVKLVFLLLHLAVVFFFGLLAFQFLLMPIFSTAAFCPCFFLTLFLHALLPPFFFPTGRIVAFGVMAGAIIKRISVLLSVRVPAPFKVALTFAPMLSRIVAIVAHNLFRFLAVSHFRLRCG